MGRVRDTIDRTPEYINFIRNLKEFHTSKGTTLQAEPILGGRRLDLYKIFQIVVNSGGFDEVTKNRGWKQVGDIFQFPSTCTNSAYILKGVYIRNLLGWEEEKLWKKDWKPPKELLGPNAHRSSTLAGKSYKSPIKNSSVTVNNSLCFDLVPTTPLESCQQSTLLYDKDKIIFALQFGQDNDIEWALNQAVSVSFEHPEQLEINESPFLLDILASTAYPLLTSYAVDHALPTTARDMLDQTYSSNPNSPVLSSAADSHILNVVLKVLHIIRNLSFLSVYVFTLANNSLIKELVVQGLETSLCTGHVELGRYSVDILENIAARMVLTSSSDPCLLCVYKVVAAHDRYLAIASIRTLTWFTIHETNQPYLESCPVMPYITQLLLSSDEELVGTVLEYIYQYTHISCQFRSNFLDAPQTGVYISLLVSLLTLKSKYFCPRFLRDDESTILSKQKQTTPHIPDLTDYHNLDEPFRCLGWLKDKFQAAERNSVLSLDDIYLLYEARFGLEKALKMKDFYTVMKIAFPSTTDAHNLLGNADLGVPVVEGLNIVGIQVKMNILNDRSQVPCKWSSCTLLFDDTFSLQRHVLHDHMIPTQLEGSETKVYICNWSECYPEQTIYEHEDDCLSHLRTHFYNPVGESCYHSSVSSPESSVSSTPSTPTSTISLSNAHYTDHSDVQGVALVACHLLTWFSKDPGRAEYFIPHEKELFQMVEQRPKLAKHISSICSNIQK